MKDVIRSIVDNGEFFEPHQHFAQNMVVCFARLNGRTIGIIANQPKVLAGCLDIDASDKATRFIRFCDAFNIPMLTIADVPGYLPGSQQEWGGIIRHGAKLLWCYSEATVPKLLLVTRKDYGGSYLAMCSKDLGADMAFAWPTAEIAVMGAAGAANIIHRKEIKAAEDPAAKRKEKIAEYESLFSNPYCAAARGYVDDVIAPRDSRPRLIEALEIMCSKRELRPPKKHVAIGAKPYPKDGSNHGQQEDGGRRRGGFRVHPQRGRGLLRQPCRGAGHGSRPRGSAAGQTLGPQRPAAADGTTQPDAMAGLCRGKAQIKIENLK
jgi:acetyl-CoA carboxylase carboxyltransferase component